MDGVDDDNALVQEQLLEMDGVDDNEDEMIEQLVDGANPAVTLITPPQTLPAGATSTFPPGPVATEQLGPRFVGSMDGRPVEMDNSSSSLTVRPITSRPLTSRPTAPPNIQMARKQRTDMLLKPSESAIQKWELDHGTLDEYARDALAEHLTARRLSRAQFDAHILPSSLLEHARAEGAAMRDWDRRYEMWIAQPNRTTRSFPEERPVLTKFKWPRKRALTPDPDTIFRGSVQSPDRLDDIENFLADEDYFRTMDFRAKLGQIEQYIAHLRKIKSNMEDELVKKLGYIEEMIMVHKDQIAKSFTNTPSTVKTPEYSYASKGRIDRPAHLTHISNLEYQARTALIAKDTPIDFNRKVEIPMYEVGLTAPVTVQDRLLEGEGDPYKYTKAVRDAKTEQAQLIQAFQKEEEIRHGGDTSYFKAPDVNGPYLKVPKVIAEIEQVKRQRELIELAEILVDLEPSVPRTLLRHVITQLNSGLTDAPYVALGRGRAPHILAALSHAELGLLVEMTEPPFCSDWVDPVLPDSRHRTPTETRRMEAELKAFTRDLEHLFHTSLDLFDDPDSHHPFAALLLEINESKEIEARYNAADAEVYKVAMHDAHRLRYCRRWPGDIRRPRYDRYPEDKDIDGPPFSRQYNLIDGLYDRPRQGPSLEGSEIERKAAQIELAAFKLGRRIRELTLELAMDEKADGEQASSLKLLTAELHNTRQESQLALETLTSGLRGDTPSARLVVLQHELVMELNRNHDIRSPCPDFSELWSFCKGKPEKSKRFFDLTRWPLTTKYQSAARIAEVQASTGFRPNLTDETLKRKRDDEDDEGADQTGVARLNRLGRQTRRPELDDDNSHEKWYDGDTLYPFGETVLQRAWLSMRMDNDLRNVPDFAHIYQPTSWVKRLFKRPRPPIPTLPTLPADWQPQNSTVRADVAPVAQVPWYRRFV